MDQASPAGGLPACCCHAQHLTKRELDVLCKVAAGAANDEIAELLGLSSHTVTRHLHNMTNRARARNRAELVARAYGAGILLPDTWPPAPSGRRCLEVPAPDARATRPV